MTFRFDEDVSAFGLFHLAFANLEQELATTLFLIRQIDDSSVTFEDVRRRGIVELKRDLVRELKSLSQLSEVDLNAQELRNICSKIGTLNAWRRERVHARVRIDEHGIAIFDAKTLKHLPIATPSSGDRIA